MRKLEMIMLLLLLIEAALVMRAEAFITTEISKSSFAILRKQPMLKMVRNIDLPECLIFFGRNTVFSNGKDDAIAQAVLRPGVERIIKEAHEIETSCLLLIEEEDTTSINLVREAIDRSAVSYNLLVKTCFEGEQCGNIQVCSPSPLGLLNAIESITINPRGFGGSSGFGTKIADPKRQPLPKHCVVFVQGEKGRDRCIAARVAGMRVLFVEDIIGDCMDDDVVDGVIGSIDDLHYIDDVATPGQYWLNPPVSRDEFGDRVDPYLYAKAIKEKIKDTAICEGESKSDDLTNIDELDSILADLDSI